MPFRDISPPDQHIVMKKDLERYLKDFVAKCYARLETGEKRYGKRFLEVDLLEEISNELIDVANYAFLEYVKVQRMKEGRR